MRCHRFSYRTSHTNLRATKIPPITSCNFSDQNVCAFSFHMKIHIIASLGGFSGYAKVEQPNDGANHPNNLPQGCLRAGLAQACPRGCPRPAPGLPWVSPKAPGLPQPGLPQGCPKLAPGLPSPTNPAFPSPLIWSSAGGPHHKARWGWVGAKRPLWEDQGKRLRCQVTMNTPLERAGAGWVRGRAASMEGPWETTKKIPGYNEHPPEKAGAGIPPPRMQARAPIPTKVVDCATFCF